MFKFKLLLFRWLLKPYVKQGYQYKMRHFYKVLIKLHVDEFGEDSPYALREFIGNEVRKS